MEKTEEDLSRNTVTVYNLPTETVRCDPATVSGHHELFLIITVLGEAALALALKLALKLALAPCTCTQTRTRYSVSGPDRNIRV